MMADAKEENMGEYIAKWHRELGQSRTKKEQQKG